MLRAPALLVLTSVCCVYAETQTGEQLRLGIKVRRAPEPSRIQKALSWRPGTRKRGEPNPHFPAVSARDVTVAVGTDEVVVWRGPSLSRTLVTKWGHDQTEGYVEPVSFETLSRKFEIRAHAVRAEDGTLTVLGSYVFRDVGSYEKSHVRIEVGGCTNVAFPVLCTVEGRFQFVPEAGRPFVLPVRPPYGGRPFLVEFSAPASVEVGGEA